MQLSRAHQVVSLPSGHPILILFCVLLSFSDSGLSGGTIEDRSISLFPSTLFLPTRSLHFYQKSLRW